MGAPIPPLEVVSNQYFRELKPYYDKVHSREPLDEAELDKIFGIKNKASSAILMKI